MSSGFVLFLTCLILHRGHTLSCLDPNNNNVDWYTAYKLPKIHKSNISMIREGRAFYYMDVHNPQWILSKVAVNETGQAISNTIQQIYNAQDKKILYIMYNDERVEQNSTKYHLGGGHTKGVVAFDNDSGFWLIHSVPKFPDPKSREKEKQGYDFPHNGLREGQSFLCISFLFKELGQIARQLQYNQLDIYDQYVPLFMYNDLPILKNLNKTVNGPPWYRVITLDSRAGQPFVSFAKSKQFSKDLYADLIAPTLKTNLLVETWQRKSHTKKENMLHSNCSIPYKVYNVQHITLPEGVTFKETKDHSKWAIAFFNSTMAFTSEEAVTPFWTCIGDINRQKPQMHKGGGSICFNNEHVWRGYKNAVTQYEHCPKN